MNEFPTCIEYLLLNHDHITVPGLGTFFAQPREAAYDAGEETMLPPRRQAGFDPAVQGQDGMLLLAICQIFGLLPAQAESKLAAWLADFSRTLADDGAVDFGSVGTFTRKDEQTLFAPTQAGITTPEYYALDTLHVPCLGAGNEGTPPVIDTKGRHITIRVSKGIAAYAAAACVAAVLFFSFSTTVSNTEPTAPSQASVGTLFVPSNLTPAPIAAEAEPQAARVAPVVEPEAETPPAAPVAEAEEGERTWNFCVVLASAVSRANAESYVRTLQGRGYETARLLEGKVLRVVVGEYETATEAYNVARRMHGESKEYQSAWVYENPSRR